MIEEITCDKCIGRYKCEDSNAHEEQGTKPCLFCEKSKSGNCRINTCSITRCKFVARHNK